MSTPTPARIAAAISDLASEQVREAWHYTNAWAKLGAASPESPVGIPLLELRHALERPRVHTQAMAAVGHWCDAGANGMLALTGKRGRGKSHAAACWALDRARKHCDTLWIACANWPATTAGSKDREGLVRRIANASALVLDDIGAGSSSAPWVAEHFEGPIMARLSRAPTLLITNKTREELRAWLDLDGAGRIWDRLAYAGGVVEIVGCGPCMGTGVTPRGKCPACDGAKHKSMRERDLTPLDEHGRSARWLACSRIVGLVGCEYVDGTLVVGGKLDAEARRVGNGVNVYAAELLGLDRDAVRARAAELEARDRELVTAAGLDVDVSDGITYHEIAPALVLRIVENQKREEVEARERADGFERARRELAPVEIDLGVTVSLAQLGAAKQLASAWRVKVTEQDDGSWRVRRVDGFVLADGLPTEALGYYHAALSVRAYQDAGKAGAA